MYINIIIVPKRLEGMLSYIVPSEIEGEGYWIPKSEGYIPKGAFRRVHSEGYISKGTFRRDGQKYQYGHESLK